MTGRAPSGAPTSRSTPHGTTTSSGPLADPEEAAVVGALIAAALDAPADNGASMGELATALAHLYTGAVRDVIHAQVVAGLRSLLREGTLAGTVRLGEAGVATALGIDVAALLGLRAQAAPLAELVERAAAYADRRHREWAVEKAARTATGPMGMAPWAGANQDSQSPTGDDPGSNSGGRRRGRDGWQFTPPLEVVVAHRWRLRCRYANRTPQGAVRGQIELVYGSKVLLAETLLIGSQHGRNTYTRAVLGPKVRRPRLRFAKRLARALVDLGASVTARLEELEGVEAEGAGDRGRWRRASRTAGGLPEIAVNDRHLREVTADSLDALLTANLPEVRFFTFGTTVARLRPGSPVEVESLSVTALKGELDRVADYVEFQFPGLKGDPVWPPTDVVRDLLALPDLPLPRLRRIATTPVFGPTPGGARLLATPGFDADSGVYLDLAALGLVDETMPAKEALDVLQIELLGDFPFADDASRAHALALVIQPFVRDLIDGPTPMYGIDTPTPGTGKDLLANVIALVGDGVLAAPMSLPRDNDELRKQITSTLLAGHGFILLDNVTVIDSASLCTVLTTTVWRDRLLGESRMVTLPNLATWMYTGNNVGLSPEMVRRNVGIRMDSGEAHPERRTGWRHPGLLGWIRAHRAELVGACISLVARWVAAGMPPGSGTLGMFESWAGVLGGILEFHEVKGFLGDRDRLDQQADRETSEWVGFVNRWWATHADAPITAGQALAVAKGGENGAAPLLLALWGGHSHDAAMMRLGHALLKQRDRRFDRWFMRDAGTGSTGGHAHRLELAKTDLGPARPDASRGAAASAVPAAEGGHKGPEGPEAPVSDAPVSAAEVGHDPDGSATPQELWEDEDAKLLAKLRTQTTGEPESDSYSETGASGPSGPLQPPSTPVAPVFSGTSGGPAAPREPGGEAPALWEGEP